jgi:hypothetical protein
MPLASKQMLALLLTAAALTPIDAGAADGHGSRTGKERLGEKWQDEQRIDNCKVPPEKRGTRPRPDRCAQLPKSEAQA